jgi:hypothetical protein
MDSLATEKFARSLMREVWEVLTWKPSDDFIIVM